MPSHLRFKGRPKYFSTADRLRHWRRLQNSPIRPDQAADIAIAWAYDERYLKQVRSIAVDYSITVARYLVPDERLTPKAVRVYIFARLRRGNAQRSSTIVTWLGHLSHALPFKIPPIEVTRIIRAVGVADLLRPPPQPRGFALKVSELADSVKSFSPKWAVLTAIASGFRRSDAVRLLVNGVTDESAVISTSEVVIFPEVEKTDIVGLRVSEPSVIVSPHPKELLIVLRSNRLTSRLADRLEREVSSMCHDAGIPDVRAPRRDLASAVGDRAAAAAILRHRPGSQHSLRYAGTRDRVPVVREAVQKARGRLSS